MTDGLSLDAGGSQKPVVTGVVGAIAAVACAQIWLVFHLNVNWDEFLHLSVVHDHMRGTLGQPLQTFHVQLFGWLAQLPLGEIGQITVGRAIMLVCELGTATLIYGIARQFVRPWAAAFGALAFLTAKFTMTQGMSFRTDPLAAFMLMSSLYLLIATPMKAWQIVMAGLFGAIAVLVTIKSGLYLPAFAAALVWRLRGDEDRQNVAVRFTATGMIGSGFLIALYLWHAGQVNADALPAASTMAGNAAKKTLLSQEFFPRSQEVMRWALGSVAALALAIFGFVQATRGRLVVLALFAAPLLSLLIYRNAFPYFFPFITPPVMVVAAVGVTAFEARRPVLLALIGLMTLGAASEFFGALRYGQTAQRQTLETVHAMFDRPVTYIDRSAMVGSYPRTGFFMSTWVMENYRERGQAVFAEILNKDRPRFLIANTPVLEAALRNQPLVDEQWRLLDADAAVLRDNFVHHWGAIWVAGKAFNVTREVHRFDLSLEGPYTLESQVGVQVDDRFIKPGEVVNLTAGSHTISAAGPAAVVLRWGHGLYRPDIAPSDEPIFHGF